MKVIRLPAHARPNDASTQRNRFNREPARWREYGARKQEWADANLGATPAEYTAACWRIASELGV